ncbi:MAG: hypothetical protein LRY27_00285 [Chitinophagales bacterium]|nr:hypothetical protein [Chitinophagales bacterium]
MKHSVILNEITLLPQSSIDLLVKVPSKSKAENFYLNYQIKGEEKPVYYFFKDYKY